MVKEKCCGRLINYILVVGLVLVALSLAQSNVRNTIDVTGDAVLYTEAGEVVVTMTAETQTKLASDAQQQNSEIINGAIAALAAEGVPRGSIETVYVSLQPVREYNETNREYVLVGYVATHTLRVNMSDISKAGLIIDSVIGVGMNRIDGISFDINDAKEAELRVSVMEQASANARMKADKLATNQNVRILGIARISEGYVSISPMREVSFAGAAPKAVTDILPGQIQITASVSASYLIG